MFFRALTFMHRYWRRHSIERQLDDLEARCLDLEARMFERYEAPYRRLRTHEVH